MCGIVGIVGNASRDHIDRLTDRLVHRGPDGRGVWTSNSNRLSFGHRRLAVIDPTASSNQPMWSKDGRYCIVFNGEIYNFRALRANLSGFVPRTESDTEVLVETIASIGIERTLPLLNGMFGFAVYDSNSNELHIARDRMGEKSVYIGRIGSNLVFASELKAISAHPEFDRKIDLSALALYLRYSYVPEPYSIFCGVQKLEPAHFVTVRVGSGTERVDVSEPKRYWDMLAVSEHGLNNQFELNEERMLDALEEKIYDSVSSRMVSDVPLGAFLSGGYDSTLVVSMMQKSSRTPVQTFSIGMKEEGYNEADHARAVANHLGTNHRELIVSPEDAIELIPQMPSTYCEPFADSSQIPTCIVSALARKHVTVALSGDGGDELFGGYNRHFVGERVWSQLRRMPRWLRGVFRCVVEMRSAEQWNRTYGTFRRLTGSSESASRLGTKLHKLARVSTAKSKLDLYHLLCSVNSNPCSLLVNGVEPPDLITNSSRHIQAGNFADLMMYLDSVAYLPGDILTKVDRAAMSVSLESRVPLLDHELVEFAWRVPQRFKIRDGKGKWAIKKIVHRHVPESLMDRPKMGFSIPIDQWLRGPLRQWAQDLLDRDRLAEDGIFNPQTVCEMLKKHLHGKAQLEHQLWSVLMFQSWNAAQ